MCLSKAYVDRSGRLELVMEDVASVAVSGDLLRLRTLFGEEKEIAGHIREIDLMKHTVLLEELAG